MENIPWIKFVHQSNYEFSEILPKMRELFELVHLDVQNKHIMLKVSFVFPVRKIERTKMINTNPILICAVAQALIERGAAKIYVGDGENAGSARYAFQMVNFNKPLKMMEKNIRKHIECVYFDEAYKEWLTPANALIPDIKLDFPKIVKDVDILISMPKLKVNVFANITLSVKNGMGFIKTATRWKYHNHNLHKMIADLYQLRPPDYVLTDAVFAGEGQGPMEANPYPMNLLLFGNNGIAVDAICCYLMGFNPWEIAHLKYLADLKLGPLDLDYIDVDREVLNAKKHNFQRPSLLNRVDNPNFHYIQGEACESGCPAFLRAMFDSYIMNLGSQSLGEMYIITGKNPPVTIEELKRVGKKRVIVYGSCAKAFAKYGRYYDGCVPNYFHAMATFSLKIPHLPLIPWVKFVNPVLYVTTTLQHWAMWFRGKKWKKIK